MTLLICICAIFTKSEALKSLLSFKWYILIQKACASLKESCSLYLKKH